jgi:hypothetical protein
VPLIKYQSEMDRAKKCLIDIYTQKIAEHQRRAWKTSLLRPSEMH